MSFCGPTTPVVPKKSCDICHSEKGLTAGILEVPSGGCVKSLFSHVQYCLCIVCKVKGWIVVGVSPIGKINYFNTKTNDLRSE